LYFCGLILALLILALRENIFFPYFIGGWKRNFFISLFGTPVALTTSQDNNSYLLSPEKG